MSVWKLKMWIKDLNSQEDNIIEENSLIYAGAKVAGYNVGIITLDETQTEMLNVDRKWG